MTGPVRVAVAGLGSVAQAVHLPLLARRADLFEVAAVAELSPSIRDTVGERYGVPKERRYPDLTSLLEGAAGPDGTADVSAVILLTSGSHGDAVVASLERGLSVFCEKPLAYTVAEADRIAAAEAALGRPALLLGYMKEYDDAVARLRERLAGIDAASIRAVDITVLHPSGEAQLAFAHLPPRVDDVPSDALARVIAADDAHLDAAVGATTSGSLRRLYKGVVLGSIVHDTSLLRSLFGGLTHVDSVRAWPDDVMPPSVEITGRLDSPGENAASGMNGAQARISWHHLDAYPAYRETLTVVHATGSLRVTFGTPYVANAVTEFVAVDGHQDDEVTTVHRSTTEAFENELVAFHRMVTAGERPRSGANEGRADIRTSQRIIRTLAAGTGIALDGEAATA